ncbi:hypothetical protein HDC33_003149 [Sporosarcina sp. JAI121]|nr:hypothetical protein [Sporosarcina sp. JAI121]
MGQGQVNFHLIQQQGKCIKYDLAMSMESFSSVLYL